MTFILTIFRSKIARKIGGVLLFILGIITFGQVQKRKGAKNERAKQERVDHENAINIRQRVRNVKRVHDNDIKYRND